MRIPICTVDAFTSEPFKGNPAAVCILEEDRDSDWMLSVAQEMNLSETAFVRRRADDDGFDLRWFTPAIEVDLCGHATLASAHALYESGELGLDDEAVFHTRSGVLRARRDGEWIELDLPRLDPEAGALPSGAAEAIGAPARWTGRDSSKYLVELDDAETVRTLEPDLAYIRKMRNSYGIVVTAPSDDPAFDFVSRFFAGPAGIDEDPVCGSAHCMLGPYWANKLGKTELLAHQCSARGGVLRVQVHARRVGVAGRAVTTMRGELTPASSGAPIAAG